VLFGRRAKGDAPILVIWPEYPPGMGGMQVHGVEFARWLHRRGTPFVVVGQAPRSPAEAAECDEYDRIHGFAARRVIPRGGVIEATLDLLSRTARSVRPRAVFCSQVAYAPALAGLGIPVACRSAGNDILRPWLGPADIAYKAMRRLSYDEQRARVAANREWVRRAAPSCGAVLCNSEWTRARVGEFLGHPDRPELAVVLGGVDTERFRPLDRAAVRREIGWPEGDEVAFLAARHTVKKGIDTAIEAVKLLEHKRPRLRLLVAGYGTETDNLRALTEELGLTDRVRFVGGLPHALMHRYLAAADVALAPSRDVYDPRRFAIDYETMGRMICEAAACGIPTVASACGGIPEVVLDGETGLLSRPNDSESVAAALDCLLSDPDRTAALGRRARAWAEEKLSFDRVNAETLAWLTPGESP
jgi:glycosyltransferase involved in cell wall biosynthesis